jgi:hypothetical protein
MFFGALGIWGVSLATRPFHTPAIRLLAVALFAFHPMALFLGASLSNDLPVAAMAALLLGYTTTLTTQPRSWRAFALWGILLAAALLTKASAIFLVLLLPFACLAQWHYHRSLRPILTSCLAATVTFALCWSLWILYNLQRGLDPLAVERSVRLAELLALRPGDLPLLLPYVVNFWRSFTLDWSVGGVGYGPTSLYWLVAGAVIAGLVGWFWVKDRGTERFLAAMHALWIVPVVLLYLASNLIVLRTYAMTVAEGRLLVLILPSVAWLTVGGWLGWWAKQWREALAWGVLLLWFVTAIWLVGNYLPWLYPRMQQAPIAAFGAATPPPALPPLLYEEKLALHEVIVAKRLTVGELTPVDLTWEALEPLTRDYTISLQLLEPLNPAWVKVETQNSYPGLGLNPTSEWMVGMPYQDRFYLRPQVDLNGPTRVHLVVWVLDGAVEGDALSVTRAGAIQDPPLAHTLVLAPATPLSVPANAQITPVEFGSQLVLSGLEVRGSADGAATLVAYWQATDTMPEDYSFFVHWLNATGEVFAQSDAMPNQGLSPTSIWRSGDVVRDRYAIPASPDTAQGVRLGVYHLGTLERLPAYQANHHLPGDAVTFALKDIASGHD